MLSEEDRAILDFERVSWQLPGPKDESIETALGLTAAVYYDRLRGIVCSPTGLAYDPLTSKRVLTLLEDPQAAGLAVS